MHYSISRHFEAVQRPFDPWAKLRGGTFRHRPRVRASLRRLTGCALMNTLGKSSVYAIEPPTRAFPTNRAGPLTLRDYRPKSSTNGWRERLVTVVRWYHTSRLTSAVRQGVADMFLGRSVTSHSDTFTAHSSHFFPPAAVP